MDTKQQFFSRTSQNFKDFFEWATKYCEKRGKKIVIVNARTVLIEGVRASGWCDGQEIVVAAKNPLKDWVFVHEFAHMTQYVEESPKWDSDDLFWENLNNPNYLKKMLTTWPSVLSIIDLERDCEKRALKLVKKWGLGDPERYAKMANAYLYYYQYCFLVGKWRKKYTCIYSKPILDLMPATILPLSKFNKIDMEIVAVMHEAINKCNK